MPFDLPAAPEERAPIPRDPFIPLNGPVLEPRPACGAGAAGLHAGELALRGIVKFRGERRALVAESNGSSYLVRAGERLCDGTVVEIRVDRIVLEEEGDALSIRRRRRRELPLPR